MLRVDVEAVNRFSRFECIRLAKALVCGRYILVFDCGKILWTSNLAVMRASDQKFVDPKIRSRWGNGHIVINGIGLI